MIGTILSNRYELLEVIGEGGMAVVYKAKCLKLNRYDAVKILKKEFVNDKELVEKFKREATAVANLSDNNLVSIYDVGTQDDINYIVMEYVKGKTLKQIIVENVRLSYERSLNIAIQITKALDCAHRNNIIHRDIKPQNIIVTDDGVVKVTDFGIAKTPTSVTITNSNKVMGSAHYFSPEQAKGNFVDTRTDIYSLGIVLYEMLTGKVPYDAESPVSVAIKHIQEPAVPPIQLNGSIPVSLNKLILKAIEKDPNNRYQSAKEMLIDLTRIQKDISYDIFPINAQDDFTRIMTPLSINDEETDDMDTNKGLNRRTKKILILTLSAILVIVLGAVLGWAFSMKNNDPQQTPPVTTEKPSINVPNVIGKSEQDAKGIVEALGLKFEVTSSEPSDQPVGTIISTSPVADTKVEKNSEVRATRSIGLAVAKIPNLIDIDIASAKEIIKSNGFLEGTITPEYNSTIGKDTIISQDPKPDTASPKNTKINLVVSKGPEYRTVPPLIGKTLAEADNLLKNVKLVLGTKTAVDTTDKALDGKIFMQSLESGSQVRENQTVNVSYNVYKEPVKKTITIAKDYKALGLTGAATKEDLLKLSNLLNITFNGAQTDKVVSIISGNKDLRPGDIINEDAAISIKTEPAPPTTTPSPTAPPPGTSPSPTT